MKKVLTTTEFVLWLYKEQFNVFKDDPDVSESGWNVVNDYAKLMQQPLELGMFVPCADGKPVKEPPKNEYGAKEWTDEAERWMKAKEQVLFEGWKPMGKDLDYAKNTDLVAWCDGEAVYTHGNEDKGKTVEEVARNLDLTPTEAFLKKIGLETS